MSLALCGGREWGLSADASGDVSGGGGGKQRPPAEAGDGFGGGQSRGGRGTCPPRPLLRVTYGGDYSSSTAPALPLISRLQG